MPGKVYLVGAGPGDPGLITLKGLKVIEKADVIVFDQLANSELMKSARPECEFINVGKTAGNHPVPQKEINQILVEKALTHSVVVRLKGGDPFVFGRGGEEGEYLHEKGILFEIIPGISSSIAVPAYAGIPVTHRCIASSFTVITGHEDPDKEDSSIDWQKIAHGAETLVILMGVANLPQIVEHLMKAGLNPDKPVAIIEKGTTPSQRTINGTLSTILELSREYAVIPPAIIVVGDVVNQRAVLNWYETLPLRNKTVWVTRSRTQSSKLLQLLYELGAKVVEFPTIQINPPDDYAPLEKAIHELNRFQWLIFTSVNGVERFFIQLGKAGKDTRVLGGIQIATIGSATADKLKEYGVISDLIPEEFVAESLLESFKNIPLASKSILIVRAQEARDTLSQGLIEMGARVEVAAAYKTVKPDCSELIANVKSGAVLLPDIVTFTSSSTVINFCELLPEDILKTLKETTLFASIGPITTRTAEKYGIKIAVQAEEYTIPGLAKALEKMCAAPK
jgi:uroporphyrinogen III methyltransferase/synthase